MMWLINRTKTKAKAHIWLGTDTVCRMASTGGLPMERYDLKEDRNGHEICHMCFVVHKQNLHTETNNVYLTPELSVEKYTTPPWED